MEKAISGSLSEFIGSADTGSKLLKLETGHDFHEGQGISVEGAGNPDEKNGWLLTIVEQVDGSTLTLRDPTVRDVDSARVFHDDSEAFSRLLQNGHRTLYVDVPDMYAFGMVVGSDVVIKGMQSPVLHAPPYVPKPDAIDIMMRIQDAERVTVTGITFDGGMDRGIEGDRIYGVSLLTIRRSANVLVEGNTFRNCRYVAATARGDNHDILFRDNIIRDTDVGFLAFPEYLGSMNVQNLTIEGNDISGGTSEGISIESGMYDYKNSSVSGIVIRGNKIENKPESAAIFYGSQSVDVLIEGNSIRNAGVGISSRDGNLEPVESLTARQVRIIGNDISETLYDGMSLEGSDVIVENNSLSRMKTGILIRENNLHETNVRLKDNQYEAVEIKVFKMKLEDVE